MEVKLLPKPNYQHGVMGMTDKATDEFMKSIKGFIAKALAAGFSLMACGLVWVVHTTQQDSIDIAVMKTLLTTITTQNTNDRNELERQIQDAKGNTLDRYTANDATKDLSIRDKAIEHNSTEIELINRRIENLETKFQDRIATINRGR